MIKLFIVFYVCLLMGRLRGRFCFFMCSRHKANLHSWLSTATSLAVILSLGCKANPLHQSPPPASATESKTNAHQQTWQLDDGSKQPSLTDKVVDWVRQSQDAPVSGYDPSRTQADIWHHDDDGDLLNNDDYRTAKEWVDQGRYADAKPLLTRVANSSPRHSSVWRRLGDCHYNLLELSNAVSAYEKALRLNRENYFAMRGLAFAYLYEGHDLWAARNFAAAHEKYGAALKLLQQCLRIYPGDLEAMYGRGMAAEGASRRLYQNALALSAQGKRQQAAAAARNCHGVIAEGIASIEQRINKRTDEVGPRNVIAGLFQRQAMLEKEFGETEAAVRDIGMAVRAYGSVLKIAPEDAMAKKELAKCEKLQADWERDGDEGKME